MKRTAFDTLPSQPFLMESPIVDYGHVDIRNLAVSLSSENPETTARRCFEWVRDHIEHSMDFCRKEVTYVASDVLKQGTGLFDQLCWRADLSRCLGAAMARSDCFHGKVAEHILLPAESH